MYNMYECKKCRDCENCKSVDVVKKHLWGTYNDEISYCMYEEDPESKCHFEPTTEEYELVDGYWELKEAV